jgi:hypothetical protein
MDPMETVAMIFWGWYTSRKLKDPMATLLSSYTLGFGENGFSSYVKNCIVWSKKHKGIRV